MKIISKYKCVKILSLKLKNQLIFQCLSWDSILKYLAPVFITLWCIGKSRCQTSPKSDQIVQGDFYKFIFFANEKTYFNSCKLTVNLLFQNRTKYILLFIFFTFQRLSRAKVSSRNRERLATVYVVNCFKNLAKILQYVLLYE